MSSLQYYELFVYLHQEKNIFMEAFYRTHSYLIEHTNAPVRRDLMDEIDWSARLIGIKGTRGVGKLLFFCNMQKKSLAMTALACMST